jgi:hypothetical protein
MVERVRRAGHAGMRVACVPRCRYPGVRSSRRVEAGSPPPSSLVLEVVAVTVRAGRAPPARALLPRIRDVDLIEAQAVLACLAGLGEVDRSRRLTLSPI